MGRICKRCGNKDMQAKVKVISKNLKKGKSFKITGCGLCVTALFLNAHEFAKKEHPIDSAKIEKMAREIDDE